MTAKRTALILCLALTLAVGLFYAAGQHDRRDDRRVHLQWWNPFSGPDGAYALALVNRFNREHPDIRVSMQRMEMGTYYNKLFVAGLGRRSPEVFVVHSDVLPRFNRAGLLAPLDGPIERLGFPVQDIDENIWSAVIFEGRAMAVPLDIHPLGMFYNKALFRDAGLTDGQGRPTPPTDLPQFMEALRRLRGDGQWGFVFTWLRTNVYAVMAQFGGRMFNDDLSVCTLDSPENIAALRFCVDLIQKEGLVPSPQGINGWTGFRQGRVGMAFEGVWMAANVGPAAGIDAGAAPLPTLGGRPATWCNSHNLCLSPGLDERTRDAAWTFIRFLSDNSLDWAQAGQVPVRKSLRASQAFQGMTIQRAFAEQIPYAVYPPRVPFVFEFLTEFDIAVERALRGSSTPEQALGNATDRINGVIRRDQGIYAQRP